MPRGTTAGIQPVRHVEQQQGFAVVGQQGFAVVGRARPLAAVDPNTRPCPFATGERRKRQQRPPGSTSTAASADSVAVHAGGTPASFVRPPVGLRASVSAARPAAVPGGGQPVWPQRDEIDLTNSSTSSESSPTTATNTAEGSTVELLREELARAQLHASVLSTQLSEARDSIAGKRALNQELKTEAEKLMRLVDTLRASEAEARSACARLRSQLEERTEALEKMVSSSSVPESKPAGPTASEQLHRYLCYLRHSLSGYVTIDALTVERCTDCAEHVASAIKTTLEEQRKLVAAANKEAAAERRAREQGDAALGRVGQAAAEEASSQAVATLSAELTKLLEDKERNAWETQRAIQTVRDEYTTRIAEQQGQINALERQLALGLQQHTTGLSGESPDNSH